jgi:hypothetical protein
VEYINFRKHFRKETPCKAFIFKTQKIDRGITLRRIMLRDWLRELQVTVDETKN